MRSSDGSTIAFVLDCPRRRLHPLLFETTVRDDESFRGLRDCDRVPRPIGDLESSERHGLLRTDSDVFRVSLRHGNRYARPRHKSTASHHERTGSIRRERTLPRANPNVSRNVLVSFAFETRTVAVMPAPSGWTERTSSGTGFRSRANDAAISLIPRCNRPRSSSRTASVANTSRTSTTRPRRRPS